MINTVELAGLEHAWLSPVGELHPVKLWGHDAYATLVLNKDYYDLIAEGWVRLSEDTWYCDKVTQKQLDVIFDWCQANYRTMPEDLIVC